MRIAYGSGAELETQLLIAKNLGFAPLNKFHPSENLLREIMKMLNKLISSLNKKP